MNTYEKDYDDDDNDGKKKNICNLITLWEHRKI